MGKRIIMYDTAKYLEIFKSKDKNEEKQAAKTLQEFVDGEIKHTEEDYAYSIVKE